MGVVAAEAVTFALAKGQGEAGGNGPARTCSRSARAGSQLNAGEGGAVLQ
ncbi:hypothetical protein MBH78_20185 [Oceanimonas sp. NS1]|nr:hypothetical protein [Oceanimonas sp. NS1]